MDPDPSGLTIPFTVILLLVLGANLHGRCRAMERREHEVPTDPLEATTDRAVEAGLTGIALILGLAAAGILDGSPRPVAIVAELTALVLCRDLLPLRVAALLPERGRHRIIAWGGHFRAPFLAIARMISNVLPHIDTRTAEGGLNGHPETTEGDDSDHTIRELLHNVYDFGDTSVREVMTPRPDIFALDATTSWQEVTHRLLEGRFSRIPIIDGDLDHVVGIVYAKDVLSTWRWSDKPSETSLRKLLQKPLFVPETQKIDELLREFQSAHVHIAIAVDEHGSTAGLVCMEDLLRELVGEVGESDDDSAVVELGDGLYRVSAMMAPEDFNLAFGTHIQGDEFETIGGFVITSLGHFPTVNEEVEVEDYLLRVSSVDGLRVLFIEVGLLDRARGEVAR